MRSLDCALTRREARVVQWYLAPSGGRFACRLRIDILRAELADGADNLKCGRGNVRILTKRMVAFPIIAALAFPCGAGPEIAVAGEWLEVTDGDTLPSLLDNTDIGDVWIGNLDTSD